MSWRKITMKFTGICIVCNQKIEANDIGFWSKGMGVKHEKCGETKELKCMVCSNPAGCPQCEFRDDCNLELVSQLCICKECGDKKDVFLRYQKSVTEKFPLLKF